MSMPQFPYGRAVLLSAGFFGINVIWALFNTLVPPLLTQFGLSATLVGFLMTWDNYVNMLAQPLVGRASDRTATRLGRRKPWMLVGAPIAAGCFAALPWSTSLWMFAAAIAATNIAMAVFRAPTVALLGDLFPPEQRSMAGAIHDLMGGLGAIAALLGASLLQSSLGLDERATFLGGAALLLASIGVVVWRVREPVTREAKREDEGDSRAPVQAARRVLPKPLAITLLTVFTAFLGAETIQTWLSSFGVFVLGLSSGRMAGLAAVFALAFLCGALPAGWLGTRFGRRQVIMAGLLVQAVVLMGGVFVTSEEALIVLLATGGANWALMSINALPLVFDMLDLSTGDGTRYGVAVGLYYLAANAAAALGPQLSGVLIDASGGNYRIVFPIGAACMVLASALLIAVRPARSHAAATNRA